VLPFGEHGRPCWCSAPWDDSPAASTSSASYIGLAPAVSASADKYRLGHISKQGSALLRWVLGQAAPLATRGDAALKRIYADDEEGEEPDHRDAALRQRGGSRRKSMAARRAARRRRLSSTGGPPVVHRGRHDLGQPPKTERLSESSEEAIADDDLMPGDEDGRVR
jgi:hypothetical protein